MAPEDVHKTDFVIPDGQYEFLRILFGEFRGLKKVLEGMSGVSSNIDDIAVYNESWEEHLRTLKELFGRLISAHPTHCLLGANKMEFLGHQIGGDVITPSHDNLERGGRLHVRPPRSK